MSGKVEDLPVGFYPHPREAPEGTLDKFVWRRLYEIDPSPSGPGVPYFEVLTAAIQDSAEHGGLLPLRVAQVSALLLNDIRTHVEQKIDQPKDLTAFTNLSFIIPHFPESYAQRAIADDLKAVGPALLDRPQKPDKETAALLLDALNSIPAAPGDERFWRNVWDRPRSKTVWSAAFVGLSRSSLNEAVRVLPQAIERTETGWDSRDAFWAFYTLHLQEGLEGKQRVAFALERLRLQGYNQPQQNFDQVLAGMLKLLLRSGAPAAHVEELEDRFYVDAAGWGSDPEQYFARRERLYPRSR